MHKQRASFVRATRVCALLKFCAEMFKLLISICGLYTISYTIQGIILLAQIFGGRCDGAYSGRGGGADNDAPAAAAPMCLWWVTF